ncbi:hypothetical protein M8542_34495 [Amycolatopsis sp. OK19-0408]|uniref:Uncharacterized protein n=1 Tax=Amycolatopsis iheyensis TaxID=2945988 RepID=A0A9X2NHL2_9PSEU|nr:hypothetical protein [Amycolatopsis iheyensis]MCR6487947.1 hypothetical protein [Amycolatopsis iheyensis]
MHPVREVGVTATLTLDHRAFVVRPWGSGFAAAAPDGALTVVDRRLAVVRRTDLGGAVADLSVSPDGKSWACVVDGRLRIGAGVDVEVSAETACLWQPSRLWVAVGTGDDVGVSIRTPDGVVVREVRVPDEYRGSAVMLCPHPGADRVVLWVAAGQDGQQSWLIHDDGTTLTPELLPAEDSLPTLFGPDGSWFLTADDDRVVRRAWPAGTEPAELRWADVDPVAEADGSDLPGADLQLLPGGYASWNTGNGRVRVLDVTTMTVVEEIVLAGHPVGTVAERYPALANDHSPCGDFDQAVCGADGMLLSVHEQRTLVLSAARDWSPDPDRAF